MQGTTPTIHCDADDGFCGNWDVDNYEACASSVGGVRVTAQHRAPGWFSGPAGDFCPEHAAHASKD
jgi:hypothetical protein